MRAARVPRGSSSSDRASCWRRACLARSRWSRRWAAVASESADPAVPTFSIVTREPGDEGDTVVVLLDPESYDTLTDIDLQNVLEQLCRLNALFVLSQ